MNSSIVFKKAAQLLRAATDHRLNALLGCAVIYACSMLLINIVPAVGYFPMALVSWLVLSMLIMTSSLVICYVALMLLLATVSDDVPSFHRHVISVAAGHETLTFRMLGARFILGYIDMYLGSFYGKFTAFTLIFMSLMLMAPIDASADIEPGLASFLKGALIVLCAGQVLLVVVARQRPRSGGGLERLRG